MKSEISDLLFMLENKCGDLFVEALAEQIYNYNLKTQQNIINAIIFITLGGLIYPEIFSNA
jgi:hypothetical protein